VRKASYDRARFSARLLSALLAAMVMGGCDDRNATSIKRAAFVRTEVVRSEERQASLTLTGELQARFRADLSFRVSGRVIARLVDVGAT
jgi:multidrug efflux pump subunit AcrA (membrane-fusion protein)